MPAVRDVAARGAPEVSRRSVVPEAAGRSLWLAAIWTGVGAAIVCATLAIVAVAISWLPVSGAHGHTESAIRAGLLTFLAALHGGITVDGTSAHFVPLGMTLVVVLAAWRAGAGLGDAASALGERDPARLVIAAALQAASFTVAALVAVPMAHLGTSSAPVVGVGAAALLLFAAAGGCAFVLACPLRDWWAAHVPSFVGSAIRTSAVAVLAYLGAGALLVAGSLAVHHVRVDELSRQVGTGWGGVPILLLGVLAAPNAAIAGTAYLSGAGFTIGSGTTVGLFTTTHGVLPAFPLLGAVPAGHGATWYVWLVAVLTPVIAGLCVARRAGRLDRWSQRLREAGSAAVLAAAAWTVLAWQGGGAIGAGRLSRVGASPWQVGGLVLTELIVVAGPALLVQAGWAAVRSRGAAAGADPASADTAVLPGRRALRPATPKAGTAPQAGKADEAGKLAG